MSIMRLKNVFIVNKISLVWASVCLSCNPIERRQPVEESELHDAYIPVTDSIRDSLYVPAINERDFPAPLYPMMPTSDNLYREESLNVK